MKFSRQDIEHLAKLAQLRLSDEEVELYREQLSSILSYAERLQQVEVGVGSEQWQMRSGDQDVRPDLIATSAKQSELMALSPWYEPITKQLRVPPVFRDRKTRETGKEA